MSELINARHEAFCRAYVRGTHAGNSAASYEAAGYAPDSSNASKLAAQPHVRKRLAELRAEDAADTNEAAKACGVDKQRVLAELSKLAFASFADCLDVNDDGTVDFDLARLDRDQVAAIREISVEYTDSADGGPRRIKNLRVRMIDKRLALADLARHLGMAVSPPAESDSEDAEDKPDAPDKPLSYEELENVLVDDLAVVAMCDVDLHDMMDRAIAAGRMRISPNAKPLRDLKTLSQAIERIRKNLRRPLLH